MLYGFRKEKRAKGQNMVEYALMLAIVVGIGWGIYDQAGLASSGRSSGACLKGRKGSL